MPMTTPHATPVGDDPSTRVESFVRRARDTRATRAARAAATAASIAVLVAGCGGSGGSTTPNAEPSNGRLKPVAQADDFMTQLRTLLAVRAQSGAAALDRALALGGGPVATAGATPSPAPASASATAFSNTVRQEAAVDEDDFIKTDGARIYSVRFNPTTYAADALQVHARASDGALSWQQTEPFVREQAWEQFIGMQLSPAAKRLVAMRQQYEVTALALPCVVGVACLSIAAPAVESMRFDVATVQSNGNLSMGERVQVQGQLVASRLIGSTLMLVSTHHPRLLAEIASSDADRAAALAALQPSDVLPTVRINGGVARPLVEPSQCFTQPGNASTNFSITTITAVDLSTSGFTWQSRCFLGGTEAVYVTADSMVLATARWPMPTQDSLGRWLFPNDPSIVTDIHKFSLAGLDIRYRASGQVKGHLGWVRDQSSYRFSEHQGDLRVLTFTGSLGWAGLTDAANTPASPATLTVLRENTGTATLDAIGVLPNAQRPAAIGLPNEQVQAVRFVGDKAYVVTFRRTDPLYVIDLSNPQDPKQMGELKVTGFSSNLLPVGNDLLVGLGHEASDAGVVQGVKVSLFDVANPASPRLIDARAFGGPGSWSGVDVSTHGVSMFNVGTTTRMALPVVLGSSVMGSSGSVGATTHRFERFEVDRATRSMRWLEPRTAPQPASAPGQFFPNPYFDRSVFIGEHLYLYSLGQLEGALW